VTAHRLNAIFSIHSHEYDRLKSAGFSAPLPHALHRIRNCRTHRFDRGAFLVASAAALHLREKIREGQRLDGLNIELFFARPSFFRPGEIIEEDIARIQWVRARKIWKLYWKRADLKWHRYDPHPEAATLAEALRVIDEDACCCFFG
jgi:hypothetical protein